MSDGDQNRNRIIAGVAGAVALGGVVLWFAAGDDSPSQEFTPEPEVARSAEPSTPVAAPRAPEPRKRRALPRLRRSDAMVEREVAALAGREAAERWLPEKDRISKLMTVIDNMAAGKVVLRELRHAKPKEEFRTRKVGRELYMDPRGYRRFEPMITAITRVEPAQAADFYHYVRPLMERAHRQLGYDAKDMDRKLMKAIDRALAAPVHRRPLRLVRPSVVYRYADPELEKMDALSKQMFRMGPDNTRRLQAWLRQLKPLLKEQQQR